MIGTGKMHEGLYLIRHEERAPVARTHMATSPEEDIMILHRHLEHMYFYNFKYLYPKLFSSCIKTKLVFDTCEFAKHTRNTYYLSGVRILNHFDVIHS